MYRRLRNVFIAGALLIIAAGYARFRMDQGLPILGIGQAPQVETVVEESLRVERGDILVTVSATGTISPNERLPMFFMMPGKVSAVYVSAGDGVLAGQLLARLDTAELALAVEDASLALDLQRVAFDALTAEPREEEIAVARAAVYAASARLASASVGPRPEAEEIARLQLELAQNQLWQSQLQRDSVQEQREVIEDLKDQPAQQIAPGVSVSVNVPPPPSLRPFEANIGQAEYGVAIAEQQLLDAQGASPSVGSIGAAQAALVSAQGQLDRLLEGPTERDLELADARLQIAYLSLERARHQLEMAELRAPFAGTVSQVNLTVGETPPTTAPAIELIDTSEYVIDLSVDEMDIAALQPGQIVEIVLDSAPGQLVTGRVMRIDNVATNISGLVTYRVRVGLDLTDVQLRAGMSATATVIVDEADDVLILRNRFIRLDRRAGQAFVTTRQPDGTLAEVEVTLGRRNETYSEIVSGLSEGDEVVLLPSSGFGNFGF